MAALMFALIAVLVFSKVLVNASALLPQKVASHFGISGQADAWTDRGSFLTLFSCVVALQSGSIPVLATALSFALAGEPRRRIVSHISFQSLWWFGLSMAFWTFMLRLFVRANLSQPPAFDNAMAFLAAGIYIVGILVVVVWTARSLPGNPDPGTPAAATA
jgi:uncharacterized membrane protein